jgi:ABC-type phosphate transport system substrate-binding protein
MFNVIRMLVLGAAVSSCTSALAEVVVVVNPSAPEASMSKEEIAQNFLGKATTLVPIDQPEGAPIRAEFYKKVTDRDLSQVKSVWSKLVFTGKATPPKDVADSAAVKKAVAANPKAIGYIDKSAVDASVKVVYTAP